MTVVSLHTLSQFAILVIATAMYAWKLPQRDGFASRSCIALALWTIGGTLAVKSGYSLYPTLTDNASFILAIALFALVVAVLTASVMAVWNCSIWTALSCTSSGYLVQGIVFGLDRALHVTGLIPGSFDENAVFQDAASLWLCAAAVLVVFYLAFARNLERSGLLGIRNPVMFFSIGVAMAVALILDLAIKDIMVYEIPFRYSVVLAVAYLVVCVFILISEFEILYNQRLKTDVATMERAVAEQERQYELSSSTIEAINRRVHDIRRHVAKLLTSDTGVSPSNETLREVVREIDVYDAAVKTGNASLDVVLTEKGLLCKQDGITLSSIADGTALSFMAAADIYTLVGTALDNAIASIRRIDDASRRSVSLNLRSQMGMASLSVESYCSGEVALIDGLPAGEDFGTEKMRAIVERYGGTIVCSADDGVLHLDIIPQG